MTRRVLAAAAAAVFMCVAAPLRGQPAPAASASPEFTISKVAKKALDSKYKKWALATLSPESSACAADGVTPSAFVQGDFNSDGQPDVAAAIKAGDTVHLVVILNRMEDASVLELDAIGQASADGYLTVRRRGDRFRNPDDGLQDFFASDTVAVVRCGQPASVYFWSGAAFRKSSLR